MADGLLFDPFAGSGTSLLAAQAAGLRSAGAECHSFVYRIAAAKLGWQVDPKLLRERAASLLKRARGIAQVPNADSILLSKCYDGETLGDLERLRASLLQEPTADSFSELLWLAITAILRECSAVGTAQWQYVLPNKTKARVSSPYEAFSRRIEMFCVDIEARAYAFRNRLLPRANILAEDARNLRTSIAEMKGQVDLVITSPPYPNNYDYADATRLEMTFWREIGSWSDLQGAVRSKLIRSCSQHSAAEKLNLGELLAKPTVAPIREELTEVCERLSEVRLTKGGKKTYHTMVAAYFHDLAQVWHELRKLCRPGSSVCFVIGDAAPYGVHVPADKWLTELAVASGFRAPSFEKIRDRNLKWKNRKHRVPLHEGNLWLQG